MPNKMPNKKPNNMHNHMPNNRHNKMLNIMPNKRTAWEGVFPVVGKKNGLFPAYFRL